MSTVDHPDGPGSAGQLEPGQRFGAYRVREVLRVERVGTLHLAEDAAGEPVLLRVLAGPVADERALAETVDNYLRVLDRVRSLHVAGVVERGRVADRPFYVLERPGGATVGDLLRSGRPLGEDELISLGRGLSAGLAALHAVGLAHGSLSPEHVILGPEGPALVDLGWSARLRHVEEEEVPLPGLDDDLKALGRLLVLVATGRPPGAELEGRRQLPHDLAELVEPLLAPGPQRRTAARVARGWHEAAVARGIEPRAVSQRLSAVTSEVRSLEDTHDGEAAPPPDDDLAPPLGTFGRYVLLEEVARGGMGVVYRARHGDFERIFALKVMLSGALADQKARTRFLREAEAAAALDHPAIVRVHDCGEVEGRAYIAMDFAEGPPLAGAYASMERQTQLLPFMIRVVRAVHYAHSRGIIHRDIKPENVLVGPDGTPRILDFGVAKRIGEEAPGHLTVSGELVGTPAYMPPEQAEGRGEDIDTRSDVYSLGATLYEAVTRGRKPFEGGSVTDILTRVLLEDPPAPSCHEPDLPWEIDAIVLKALEKEPDRRYQSAAELAEDLERYLKGLPIRARQATWLYRARKWAGRRRRAVLAVGLALTLATSLGGAAAFRLRRAQAARQAQVQELLRQGETALGARELAAAHDLFVQVLALEPGNRAAGLGRDHSRRLLEERREAEEQARRREREREQARELVAQGQAALERRQLEEARRAFEQALAFHNASERARDGLVEAQRRLADQRQRSQLERDLGVARAYEDEGRAALEEGDLRAAQAAFLKASAFGSETAPGRLAEVEAELDRRRLQEIREELARRDRAEGARLLGEARTALAAADPEAARKACLQALAFGAEEGLELLQRIEDELLARRQEELRRRDHDEAERRVAEGRAALAEGELEAARTAFLQALAFEGSSEGAQQGLLEVDRALEARERFAARSERAQRAQRLVAEAREVLERGREAFRRDPWSTAAREDYLRALEALDRAVFLAPHFEPTRRERERTAREAALVLREQGLTELAAFVARMAGTEDAPPAPVELPRDPHLVVREADQVSIRRAFGGAVRFEPTRALDHLRDWVAERGDRHRLIVEVRSQLTASLPPQVYVTALWVRVEDKVTNTLSPFVKVELEGGPFLRQVNVDAHGRLVRAWERSLRLDVDRTVARVEEAARRLVKDSR